MDVISEVFLAGTEPAAYCSPAAHLLLQLPLRFQQFAVNEAGELLVPEGRVAELVAIQEGARLVENGALYEVIGADGLFVLPVRIVPDAEAVDGMPPQAPPSAL